MGITHTHAHTHTRTHTHTHTQTHTHTYCILWSFSTVKILTDFSQSLRCIDPMIVSFIAKVLLNVDQFDCEQQDIVAWPLTMDWLLTFILIADKDQCTQYNECHPLWDDTPSMESWYNQTGQETGGSKVWGVCDWSICCIYQCTWMH